MQVTARDLGREDRREAAGGVIAWDPGLAHAVENGLELGQERPVVTHRRPGGAGAGNGEGRVKSEAGFDSGMCLVQAAKLR